jgi:hypothetical protein
MKNLIFLIFLMVLFVSCKKEKMNEWRVVVTDEYGVRVYQRLLDPLSNTPPQQFRLNGDFHETQTLYFEAKYVGSSLHNPQPISIQNKDRKIFTVIRKNGDVFYSGYLEPSQSIYAQDSSLTYSIRLQ